MPIVFVHGVNNRTGEGYRAGVDARNGFLSELVAPALGFAPGKVKIYNPYWGDVGARFRWGMAVRPRPEDEIESLGSGVEVLGADGLELALSSGVHDGGGIVDLAKRDFPAAVELLVGSALLDIDSEEGARELAEFYEHAESYALANPSPTWLGKATENNFAYQLERAIKKRSSEETLGGEDGVEDDESLGGAGIADRLRESLSRLTSALPAKGSDLLVRLTRRNLNATVTRFVGDVFEYLARRGTIAKGEPGPITEIVLKALKAADDERKESGEKLVIIAHSFGGEIVYDILTSFAPELHVDCLVTVGSQVGLFEEMKLYAASRDDMPADPPAGRVAMPPSLARWINVIDTKDILSFLAAPVFRGAEDFHYDSGLSALQSHGGYFTRPSFYSRLAKRLRENAVVA